MSRDASPSSPAVAGPVGSLALSVVRPHSSSLALCVVRWHRDLVRLGITLPFHLVHDLGLVLATPNEQLAVGPRRAAARVVERSPDRARVFSHYRTIVEEVADSGAARRSAALSMTDDLVVAVLARLLGTVAGRTRGSPQYPFAVPLDARLFDLCEPRLPELFEAVERDFDLAAMDALAGARLHVLTLADALDLDSLQLFGMVGGDTGHGAIAQVDLLAALGSPEANDVVRFSLEILPSVLEAKSRMASGRAPLLGYSGLSRRGSIDSLVLTELAWDEPELSRRLAEDEVMYYARENHREEARRVHHLLIDASASMRGERATFARGIALAWAKLLLLAGDDVIFRFFDSRLYEPHAAARGKVPLAHLLAFRGERGRNPARVARTVLNALELAARTDPREPILHLFTHSASYVPRETIEGIKRLAKVFAVFLSPASHDPDLDYLDLLDAHWTVGIETLADRRRRADRALDILVDVDATWRASKESGP